MKLAEKKRVGSKIVKKYGVPQTPLQRLLNHPDFPKQQKEALRTKLAALDPFNLQNKIQKKLKAIFKFIAPTAK